MQSLVDDDDDLIELCFANGWTDGLPVIPPTAERVEAMVAMSGLARNEVVAKLGIRRAEATVEQVAANAIMAGCRPEYLPVVIAAVKAAEPMFAGGGVTIHSASVMALVNGPLRDQLGYNYKANALGSGNRANATTGRALRLVLQNLGGLHPGGMDASTLGHPGKYSYCFAEHEEANPWQPLHIERGFAPGESTVTLYYADAPLCLSHLGAEKGLPVLNTIADAMNVAGTYNMFFHGELFVVLSPEHASLIAGEGLSKDGVRQYLYEHSRRRAEELAGKGLFEMHKSEGFGPGWWRDGHPDPNLMVAPVDNPKSITLVVAGREVGGYSAVIFGSGGASVTRKIERSP